MIDMGAYENISLLRPTFGLDSDSLTVNEDSGAYIAEEFAEGLSANDDGQSLTGFTVTTNNDTLFSNLPAIDLSGTLIFTLSPDGNGSATVSVYATDDGSSQNISETKTFTINVEGSPDPPTDLTLPIFEISENETFVDNVFATEPFGEEVSYSITGGKDSAFFTIVSTSGRLSFLTAPDYELPSDQGADNSYEVEITATGSDGATSSTFNISVVDVPEGDLGEFRFSYNLAPDGSDDMNDWSGNGIANAFYYVFGLGDPNEAEIDRSLLPTTTQDGDNIIHSYRYAFPEKGFTIREMTSTDLTSWDYASILFEAENPEYPVNVNADTDGEGFYRVSITYPATNTARFFSVEVTMTE